MERTTLKSVDGLYNLYTPTEPLGRNRYVTQQRIKRIKPLLKDMQVGQAFAIERGASHWVRVWLVKNKPTKKFVIRVPKDKNKPAEVRMVEAKVINKRGPRGPYKKY